jgi:pimeloyl-ACP methyl ester carboxylesterase
MSRPLETLIGVLNGAVGDYLHRTRNGLATPMELVHEGRALAASRDALAAAHPQIGPRAVVLVHGLMSTEDVFLMPDGESYGSLLSQDLGYTPFAVRYNSGRHVSENGESLDALLEALVAAYPGPLEELALVGHSMGGLVIRSATHVASARESRWLPLARRAFYLGTPHLGAPLERVGNALGWALRKIGDPVTVLIADLAELRSSGVKDLRYGSLRREDWEGADPDELLVNRRHPVPLLPHVRHHLVAGTLGESRIVQLLFGDAMVPLPSAAGRARPAHRAAPFPPERVRVLPGTAHLRLAHDPGVYALIRAWCEEELRCDAGEG